MAVINNLQAFDAAVRAVCPAIDGVAADGTIFFQVAATPTQISAANAAAAAYTDAAPQLLGVQLILDRLIDAEYAALWTFASTHPNLHRALISRRDLDLTQTIVQNLIQALVTANVLTQARATAVFVAPPLPPPSPIAPAPIPKPVTS